MLVLSLENVAASRSLLLYRPVGSNEVDWISGKLRGKAVYDTVSKFLRNSNTCLDTCELANCRSLLLYRPVGSNEVDWISGKLRGKAVYDTVSKFLRNSNTCLDTCELANCGGGGMAMDTIQGGLRINLRS